MGCSCGSQKRTTQTKQTTKKRFTINGQRTTSTNLTNNKNKVVRRIIGH